MKKWYHSCQLLLVAAMSLQLAGCASTSRTISKWTGRDRGEDQIAQLEAEKSSKSSETASKSKASSSSKSKSDELLAKKSTDTKSSPTKDGTSNSKPPVKAEVAGKAPTSSRSEQLAKRDQELIAKASAPARETSRTSRPMPDDIDEFPFAKIETKPKSADVKTAQPAESDPFASFPVDHLVAKATESTTPSVPQFESQAGEVKLGTGGLKPRSASAEIAKGTHKLTSDQIASTSGAAVKPALENQVARAAGTNGLPVWALEDSSDTVVTPQISQTAATETRIAEIQPGLPAPTEHRLPAQQVLAGPKTSLTTLCPEAQGEVRQLVETLDSQDSETLKRSIHRLGRMQVDASAAAPALRELLGHKDGFVRVHAALALVRMQQPTAAVTQTLIESLRSKDPGIRSFSAAVLAEMGPYSTDALPALSASLHDDDGYVRLHAAEVLIRHEDWSYPALATISKSLRSNDENVRWLATYSLAELAPQSEEAVSALTVSLRDPVGKVQVGAAYALGEIGPMSAAAIPELERALQSPNTELRAAAEYALSQIRQ